MTKLTLLEHADNCNQLAEDAKDEPSRRRYQRLERGWRALADTQDWLDGKVSPSRAKSANC